MAIKEFRLPDPGEGLVEADIVTWRVAVGDEIKINDILVEIETSKSLVELPSPYEGTVTGLLVSEGDTVDVGVPIIAIDDGTEPVAPAAAPAVTLGRRGRGERRAGRQPGRLRRQAGRHPPASPQERGRRGRAGRGARAGEQHLRHRRPGVAARRSSRGPAAGAGAAAGRSVAGARTDGAGDGAAVVRCGAGQAARPQARPRSRRRPRHPDRHRHRWGDHPGRRRVGRRTGRPLPTAGPSPASGRGGRRGPPHPDQGGAQGHRRGDGAVGVHRSARDRVGGGRRHRDDGAGAARSGPGATSPTSRSRRC